MYQNIDNMICDADSCEAAICECKRMRKADITAAIIWAAVAVIVYRLLLLHSKRQKMVKIGQTILR